MKGAILEKGQKCYTYLDEVFPAFENEQLKYNWLITNLEYNYSNDSRLNMEEDYIWLSGKELTDIVNTEKIQFIWGVLSAFSPHIMLDQILQYKLPIADEYEGFWSNPISIQHPLAEIELIPWDSSLVLLIARTDTLVDKFLRYFPLSEDLSLYNTKRN